MWDDDDCGSLPECPVTKDPDFAVKCRAAWERWQGVQRSKFHARVPGGGRWETSEAFADGFREGYELAKTEKRHRKRPTK